MASKRAAIGAAPPPISVQGWLVLAGGVATAAVILVAWLPVGALLHQRAELATATTRLSVLSSEGRQLAARAAQLREPGALAELGRADYQLVQPGQVLIQVLTPSFTPTRTSADAPYPGDPGRSPLVNPAEAGVAPVAPVTRTAASHAAAHHGSSPGFAARVVAALEFWR